MEVSNQKKEAYYTATQMQLVRTRFFGNRSAMIAGSILLFMKSNIEPAIIADLFPKKRVLTNCICVAV